MAVDLQYNNTVTIRHEARGLNLFLRRWTALNIQQNGDPWLFLLLVMTLTNEEVILFLSLKIFRSFETDRHKRPNFKFLDIWQTFVRVREAQTSAIIFPIILAANSQPLQSVTRSFT